VTKDITLTPLGGADYETISTNNIPSDNAYFVLPHVLAAASVAGNADF